MRRVRLISINPILYGLQDAIEKEQERVIADTVSPAHKVVERLVALDNRRIDLCNLKVLYEFIRRETGVEAQGITASAQATISRLPALA